MLFNVQYSYIRTNLVGSGAQTPLTMHSWCDEKIYLTEAMYSTTFYCCFAFSVPMTVYVCAEHLTSRKSDSPKSVGHHRRRKRTNVTREFYKLLNWNWRWRTIICIELTFGLRQCARVSVLQWERKRVGKSSDISFLINSQFSRVCILFFFCIHLAFGWSIFWHGGSWVWVPEETTFLPLLPQLWTQFGGSRERNIIQNLWMVGFTAFSRSLILNPRCAVNV